MKLIYKQIFQTAKPLLAQCRLWDLWHAEISISHMEFVLNYEKLQQLENILIPTIILHDIGWSQMNQNQKANYKTKDMRIKHMEIGASLAEKILRKVGYPSKLIPNISQLISTHDNKYLGIKPKTIEDKIIQEVDIRFPMSYVGFWIGYHRTKDKESLSDFLAKRYQKTNICFTQAARMLAKNQLIQRKKEINQKITPQQRYKIINSIVKKKNMQALF